MVERLIKRISDDIEIVYDNGKFDEWCVYIKNGRIKTAPKDIEYFTFFKKLGKEYSNKKVYFDFVKIYKLVSGNIQTKVLDIIIGIAKNDYDIEISKNVAINFIVIYAGMIAERNKKYSVLKERIKRLGMYQILMQNYEVEFAANFSKGKKAKDLLILCKKYGF